jgi:hypothetical protein
MTEAQIQHIADAIAFNGFWTERCGPVVLRTELRRHLDQIEAAVRASTLRDVDSLVSLSTDQLGEGWEHIVLDPAHHAFANDGGVDRCIALVKAHIDQLHSDPDAHLACFGMYTGRQLPEDLR